MSGQTVVDPKGYLTDLNSITPQSTGDIKLVESLNYQQVGFMIMIMIGGYSLFLSCPVMSRRHACC